MSLLSVGQSVAKRVGVSSPASLIGATGASEVRLLDALQWAAEYILDDHPWQQLIKLDTFSGDGSTTTFALPSDFHRLPHANALWNSRTQAPLTEISADTILGIDVRSVPYVYGAYTKIADQIRITPTMESGETTKYYYISNLIASPESGDDAAEFAADTDTFVLGENLLENCAVWRWKSLRGLPAEQAYSDYRRALGKAIERSRGPTVIDAAPMTHFDHVPVTYPWSVEV